MTNYQIHLSGLFQLGKKVEQLLTEPSESSQNHIHTIVAKTCELWSAQFTTLGKLVNKPKPQFPHR